MLIRDAIPSEAPFLAQCILAGMHLHDFEGALNDGQAVILKSITQCEERKDTLYSYANTRVAEVDGVAAGSLLSYPGELYKDLKEKTFREFWPDFFTQFDKDEPETGPGEYYLDSLAVLPAFRKQGIGRALILDGVRKGLSLGFRQVALVVDPDYPHLVRLYESLGFVPAGRRNAFGTDFLRMIYCSHS